MQQDRRLDGAHRHPSDHDHMFLYIVDDVALDGSAAPRRNSHWARSCLFLCAKKRRNQTPLPKEKSHRANTVETQKKEEAKGTWQKKPKASGFP